MVTVYTSRHCLFCEEAIRVIGEAADRLSYVSPVVRVVDVESEHLQSEDITAVPTVEAGKQRIVGVPTVDEVTRLVQEALITQSCFGP